MSATAHAPFIMQHALETKSRIILPDLNNYYHALHLLAVNSLHGLGAVGIVSKMSLVRIPAPLVCVRKTFLSYKATCRPVERVGKGDKGGRGVSYSRPRDV